MENTGGFGQSLMDDLNYEDYEYNLYGTNRGKENKFIPGLSVNTRTRPLILDALYTHVKDMPDSVKSKKLAIELLNLVSKKDRFEADKGFHDDLAMAYGFCCYIRKFESNNLIIYELTEHELERIEHEEVVGKILDLNIPGRKKINPAFDNAIFGFPDEDSDELYELKLNELFH